MNVEAIRVEILKELETIGKSRDKLRDLYDVIQEQIEDMENAVDSLYDASKSLDMAADELSKNV